MLTKPGAPGDAKVYPRAKIICTLGPSTSSVPAIESLLDAGMDVARLNFSHGTHAEHARRLRLIRRLSKGRGKHVAILMDLQGPKIRTGQLEGGRPVTLQTGSDVVLTTRPIKGSSKTISTSFLELSKEVRPGSQILLSDGLLELRVLKLRGRDITCRVVAGGELGERQGINLPNTPLRISALTAKDKEDLQFGIKHGVDYIALSFVRSPEDILELKRLLAHAGKSIPVVAKLEKPEAVDCLDEILRVTDAVMVARGDLGVELPPESVPIVQKRIVERANEMRIPVIIATQMLESMKAHPTPTRAEASDVANAILEGADALMLSGETASGKFPTESVRMMARIIAAAEASPNYPDALQALSVRSLMLSAQESICESAAHMASELNLKAVAVFTQTGSSARVISKYHPQVPVYAFSPLPSILTRVALYWGVRPVYMHHVNSTDRMVEGAAAHLRRMGAAEPGDLIAVIAGTPIARRGTTNLLKLHRLEK
jgi:pyruvate kinase